MGTRTKISRVGPWFDLYYDGQHRYGSLDIVDLFQLSALMEVHPPMPKTASLANMKYPAQPGMKIMDYQGNVCTVLSVRDHRKNDHDPGRKVMCKSETTGNQFEFPENGIPLYMYWIP